MYTHIYICMMLFMQYRPCDWRGLTAASTDASASTNMALKHS